MIFKHPLYLFFELGNIQFEVSLSLLDPHLEDGSETRLLILQIKQEELILREFPVDFDEIVIQLFKGGFDACSLCHIRQVTIICLINPIQIAQQSTESTHYQLTDQAIQSKHQQYSFPFHNSYLIEERADWKCLLLQVCEYYYQIYFIIKMSSPSKFFSSSPIRNLEDKYYSKPLEIILEEQNAFRLSNSLILKNQILEQQNQRLLQEYSLRKGEETYQFAENARLKQERDFLSQNFRTLEAQSIAENEAKEKQLEGQERDIRFLREEYNRENQALRDQVNALSNKIVTQQTGKLQDIEALRTKYLTNTAQETDLVRRNLGEELRQVFGQLEVTRQLLAEKQRELQHLFAVSQQNSSDYTGNLERLISENNVLRNQLLALELEKNKEIQVVENKKELEKSRTIGILSFCKENNHFMEKELTRLAEQLLEKNISIESFTKELLKQRKQSEANERRFEDLVAKVKQESEAAIAQKEAQLLKNEKIHKSEIEQNIEKNIQLQQQLSSKQNELENTIRELDYLKKNIHIKEKEIEDLKDNINRMHEDHSKELSKVMTESRVKRRSGLNISSYSSSSLKDIEEAQGSSILKGDKFERKSSFSNEGSGRLPTVKQQLAVSHGQIDEDDEDIQIKELILHYESMIEQLKKNKANELQLANGKIDTLKQSLLQKESEIIELLGKYSPLMDVHFNKQNIEAERRSKIEQTQKGDISILSVLLDKYQIVSLKPRGK